MAVEKYRVSADFLDSGGRRLFYLHLKPPSSKFCGSVLFLPPFAEEMHMSRRVVACQARRLAAAGYQVMLLDLTGCGDSSGEFVDATWEHWIEDVHAAVKFLSQDPAPLTLWGLRLGALLAIDSGVKLPSVTSFLLWQPVLNGEQQVDQFLRLLSAASALSDSTTFNRRELWSQLRDGHNLEVAGYELSSALALGLAKVRLADLHPPSPVDWLEIGNPGAAGLSVASQKVLQKWEQMGVVSATSHVGGEPFWRITDANVNPDLETATLEMLS